MAHTDRTPELEGVLGDALTMVRILIADDHEIVRAGLQKIIDAHFGWQVVALAGDGREAVEKAAETQPDVAVIDYSLPLLNGVEVTRRIRAQVPKTEVLIFTMYDNETLILDLLQAGARGYLLKSDANRHLISAIEALSIHQPYFTSDVTEALLRSSTARPGREGSALTGREREVVQLIAEGHSNKATARMLGISLKTVETHRSAAMRKLNISSSAALVRYAVRNKLVEA
jgi:DNA-binding NarL/FixJ family response regulator